ncbi:hypothetical protein ACN28S_62005 [Cystobacter fuscus]
MVGLTKTRTCPSGTAQRTMYFISSSWRARLPPSALLNQMMKSALFKPLSDSPLSDNPLSDNPLSDNPLSDNPLSS